MAEYKKAFKVKGAPLIKFQCKDKIEELRKGHLYAKTLKYYRELEKETGDATIGDKYEGMLHINEGRIKFPDIGQEIILNDDLITTSYSDSFVFCMFGISPTTDFFAFSNRQKREICSFGDTALVILDKDEFVNRVKTATIQKNLEVYFDVVQYYDPSIDNGNMIFSLYYKGMWNIAYWKRMSYNYQQEVRFLFVSKDDKSDHIELDIGDISDITTVVSTKQILTAKVEKAKEQ